MTLDTIALLILIPTLWGLFGYMVYKDINPLKEILEWCYIVKEKNNEKTIY